MAARSLFLALTRSRGRSLAISRPLSSGGGAGADVFADSPSPASSSSSSSGRSLDELRSQIFRLRFPKRSATNLLQKWVTEGNTVTLAELRKLTKDLNRAQRYKHALEILTWMEAKGSFKMSALDRSVAMELILKLYSILEAEKYFDTIPDRSSQKAACVPLLHYYVKQRDKRKAESFMLKLQALGLTVTSDPFNEMMKLYVSLGHFKKVLLVIKQMKHNKIPRSVLSYNIWMDASHAFSGISSVETVYVEMVNDRNVKVGWSTLCTLSNLYIKAGLFSKALDALRAAEEKLSTKNRLGYFFLITLYATLSNKDGVIRLWKASKDVPGRFTCANYMCMLSCLVKLDEIREAEKVFETWENDCRRYDVRVSNVLLGAYMRKGWMEKAEMLHLQTLQKGGSPNYKTWEILMEGWIKKREMLKAIEAMKKGLSMLQDCSWCPPTCLLMSITENLEEMGIVEDAEKLVNHLHQLKIADLPVYKCLLRMYIRVERYSPEILEMMYNDKIKLDEEASQLIEPIYKISLRHIIS